MMARTSVGQAHLIVTFLLHRRILAVTASR
jgi:hypothetical protein